MQNSNEIKAGDAVKFAVELTPGENDYPMTVIEANGDRCLICTDCGFGVLNPTRIVLTSELVKVS